MVEYTIVHTNDKVEIARSKFKVYLYDLIYDHGYDSIYDFCKDIGFSLSMFNFMTHYRLRSDRIKDILRASCRVLGLSTEQKMMLIKLFNAGLKTRRPNWITNVFEGKLVSPDDEPNHQEEDC